MSDHDQPVAGNLLDRQFTAEAPNQRWVGDTTEFVIGSSAKLYLAVILPGPSRQWREHRRPGRNQDDRKRQRDSPEGIVKSAALPVLVDNIPDAMKHERRWMLWRYERQHERWTKPPFTPDGYRARHNQSAAWREFDE